MTLPEQSDRAVAQTREFLVRLASPYGEGAIKGIRREVRDEASRLLRHYPLSWNGDCPNQDNAANEDKPCPYVTGKTTQYCTLTPFTLTDEDREAVAFFADIHCDDEPPHEYAATLRSLLERLA
jgi:hypothetical protein